MLVGRDAEQERVGRLLDAVGSGTGGALAVRGEAGIGKTALLEWTIARARKLRVLRTVGIESETELPFSALHELVYPVREGAAGLPGPQQRALAAAFAHEPSEGVDRFAVYAAALGLLAAVAEVDPLLCVVDDAQWLDDSSAAALLFAARRVQNDPVLIVFAVRDPVPAAFSGRSMDELHLLPLAETDAQTLLAGTAPSLTAGAAANVLEAARGNPLALIEYASAGGSETLESPLPISDAVQRLFIERSLRLSDDARRALLIAAVGDPATPDEIWGALEDECVPIRAVAEARDAGLLRRTDLDFSHPLARSAFYRSAAPSDLRAAHDALAQAVRDPARRAWHLAAGATEPDENVARELELAAGAARARGGVSAEARALERAARLTPAPDEQARRLLRAGLAESASGRYEVADALFAEAAALTQVAAMRAEAEAQRSYLLFDNGEFDRAVELARRAADRAEPALEGRILTRSGLVHAFLHRLAIHEARATAERAAELVGTDDLDVRCMLAWAWELSGRTVDALDLVRDSAERVEPGTVLAVDFAARFAYLERYAEARALLERIIEHERAAGAIGNLAYALDHFANLQLRTGRLTDAYRFALESTQLMEDIRNDVGVAASAARLGLIEATLGASREAQEHGKRGLEVAEARGDRWNQVRARAALGLDALSRGDAQSAVRWLEPAVAMLDAGGVHHPNMFRVHGDLIEAKARLGSADEAFGHFRRLQDDAKLTRSPWALAVTARCEAVLAGVGDEDAAFEAALEAAEENAGELERARTQLAYGERLRRSRRRRDARDQLHDAVETFDRLGARQWAERARTELRATGERLRPRGRLPHESLTPQELQVALAAADGLTNREIAARLFLSPKTVEFHLSRAYRKLGVRSRVELVRALAGQPEAPQPAAARRR